MRSLSRAERGISPRNDKVIVSRSESNTERIAAQFAQAFRGGEVVLLNGDLGAGKTVFVRGLAKGLGVRDRITSPTFVLMRVHRAVSSKLKALRPKQRSAVINTSLTAYRLPLRPRYLVHVDAYRIRHPREIETIGLPEWVSRSDTVVVIEWGERVQSLFQRISHYAITIGIRTGDARVIRITPRRRTLPRRS